ncbi:contractile injection system tape measure protein [uncultured Aquimarina sp.]|uniref:contractile injection system tape measure protein n=1 Tax=uncultured Aquimarina sp. TaxID=575652 RepID=UPI0026335CBC|nr:contractile injection system tape measure protein [uncultured Aquimarina sp.]
MTPQKHIINRQILEIHLPTSADTFAMQQELSALCRQQLTKVMDRVFSNHTSVLGDIPVQIDRLTLDLGELTLDNFETVFEEKLQEELTVYQESAAVAKQRASGKEEKTPLRAVAYYLKNGILPWWAKETTKTYVQQQLEQLLEKPTNTFITLLQQLRWNTQHLNRLVHISTEAQLLQSLQLISSIAIKEITTTLQKFQQGVQVKHGFTKQKIQAAFWKTAFQKVTTTKVYSSFEQECLQETMVALGIADKGGDTTSQMRYAYEIRSIVADYKMWHTTNTVWQEFFRQLSTIVDNPFLDQLPAQTLQECIQLLRDVGKTQGQAIDANHVLTPLATYINGVQKQVQQIASKPKSIVDQLPATFEDTDFISIQNAGLVLFWPFLVRFFENLGLITDKTFTNATARHTAICALQYLCEGEDQELFEGALPLNKLLCGVAIEEVISPITLSEEEKEMAEGLLSAVIGQGPHWKNLSIDGFRTSYLCRPGSLRTRDGHWLLQVQRETHDITLEKLPWGFHTVKLPWMTEVLVVEWL